jgi:serine phosphatase RsbU (regulator of sigma subunit)
VPKSIPNYLRVFSDQIQRGAASPAAGGAELDELCSAFERVTGWSLRDLTGAPKPQNMELLWSAPVEPASEAGPGQLRGGVAVVKGNSQPGETDLTASAELALAIGKLWRELQQTRETLRRREAELAAGVPLVSHHAGQRHLADRLEHVLRGGAEILGCHAAALYLLNEGTTELKLRSCWGLPQERLMDEARPLETAVADLEALAGHAVVLDDTEPYRQWNLPEDFPAAVCVPVSSPTTPLGCLWLFCKEKRPFSDEEVNLVEIVAGRIASDLEREMLMTEGVEGARLKQQLVAAERFEHNQRPHIAPLLDDWDVAGWTEQAAYVGGDFYDWFVRDDEQLVVSVADCSSQGLEAALAASGLRSALRSHAEHLADPGELLERVNRSLWTASAGDQSAALVCAFAEPKTGRLRFASAGHLGAAVLSAQGVKALVQPNLLLGMMPETRYQTLEELLSPGDSLVLFTEGVRAALEEHGLQAADPRFFESILAQLKSPAADLLHRVCDQFQALSSEHSQDRTILVLKRRRGRSRKR